MVRYHPLAQGVDGAPPRLGDPRLSLAVVPDIIALQVMALPGEAGALAAMLGLDPVSPSVAARHDGLAFLPLAPGEWLAFGAEGARGAADLAARIGAGGHLCDLGDSLAALEISGDLARAVLSRFCRLDLDHWTAGSCARTEMAGLSVTLYRPGAEETYLLLVAVSMARSFWHWLKEAALSALCTG